VVIHCAGRISIHSDGDPMIYQTNVTGTMNMFNAALQAGVKRFIHISSIHAFDQVGTDGLLNEESPYCKETAPRYDRSKRDAQQFILKQASERMEVIVLNPTSVVGPNDFKPSLMGKAIMDIYNRKVPMLITGGFDFVDVRDVASAIISAIDRGRTGQAYLLAGRWYSLVELQDIIFRIKGENKRIPVLPACTGFLGLPFIRLLASFNGKEPLYTKESLLALIHGNKNISSRKAAEELGYTPRPFEETIRDSISWFKQAGYLQ
jgi:dihydroflavonol-4-reductase